MSFEHHRRNLMDWLFLEDEASGIGGAHVLLLGDKDEVKPFYELLKRRRCKVSDRTEPGLVYDWILVPMLTRRILAGFRRDPREMFKSLTETWLAPSGKLVVGMENACDIDRLASGQYENEIYYMTEEVLRGIRTSLKESFPSSRELMYFPMPELEMPLVMYSEERLPAPGEEDDKTTALVHGGEFGKFAPAWLYVFTKDAFIGIGNGKKEDIPLYIKYNSSRRAEYAIKTVIYRDAEGRRHVRKESITPEANTHVESLIHNAELVRTGNPGLQVLKAEVERKAEKEGETSYVIYPFVSGKSVAEELGDKIKDGTAPVEEIRAVMRQIIGKDSGVQNPANLDGLFQNVLMDGAVPTLIDCEWVLPEDTEVKFLEFRMLKYWYLEYKDAMAYTELASFLRLFGFTAEDLERYDKAEAAFQKRVHGDGEESNLWAYQSGRVTLKNFLRQKAEITEQEATIQELARQVKERDIALRKEREVSRLTNVHVGNLEKVIAIHERDINTLMQEREYYKKHQSWSSKKREALEAVYDKHFPYGSRKRKIMDYAGKTIRHPIHTIPMYFSDRGRNLIKGDFRIGAQYLEGGKLCFERTDAPLVSIVIPCYNQINYTYQCLLSILRHTDFKKTPYEVIIADDVSQDATKDLAEFSENLVIARNTENMGFLRNCNQAAARARGRYIFFLNNDTEVKEGWLSSLVDLIESDQSIGMVGSKLVYPDGRLQEAGGIIWSDASGWNYGRLQDPEEPEYNYVKDVDYISGAAIMIRAELWREIGGFDELFAPAYCEDSDLAFEVRRHGKRVVYQPKSVVIHYEGISNGTDVQGTGLKRYQLVNQEKFREKWKKELAEQSVNTGSPNPFKARERGQNSRYILVVDHYVPTWDKDAGSKTTYQYLQMFVHMGYKVKFLGDNFLHEEPYTSVLEQMGIEVLYGKTMQANIWNWIDTNKDMINIAFLERPHIATKYIDYIREHTGWKCIFYGHDLHFLRERREYEITHDEAILEDSEYWRSLELSVMKKADISYYPSQVEVDAIHEIDPSIPAKAITAYVFKDPARVSGDYAKREGLLFVGGFAHPPNKDGLLWFADHILPEIQAAIPGVKFRVAGSHPDDKVLKLNEREGIEVLGFVSDERLEELYQESRIVVVPLRYGAGVKGKVVEALHEGAAIVTTSCGAEGIPGVEQALMIRDDEHAFAEEVISLYHDVPELGRLSKRAQQFVSDHFSVEGAWSRIREDFETDLNHK